MLNSLKILRNRINQFIIIKRFPHSVLGKNCNFNSGIFLKFHKSSTVRIGDFCTFNNSTNENHIGINKACSLVTTSDALLSIGTKCGFSGVSICSTSNIEIGNYCNFGANVSIWDSDFHPIDYLARRKHDISKIKSSPIFIGNDVFVGANSIILKGVKIGDRAIVGAGSVVTKDIPSDEIWGGNPAKFLRKLQCS